MTKLGSVKETGEEIPEEKWRRFEAAVGVDKDRRRDERVETAQPFREEVENPDQPSGEDSEPDDAGDPRPEQDASKTTKRTE